MLGKSTVILVIVAIAAIALNLAFAHSLHFEPLGLLGFGLFCLGYAGIIPFAFPSHPYSKDPSVSAQSATKISHRAIHHRPPGFCVRAYL